VGDEAAGWREGCLRTAAVRAALSIICRVAIDYPDLDIEFIN